jgi:hypothetical protein
MSHRTIRWGTPINQKNATQSLEETHILWNDFWRRSVVDATVFGKIQKVAFASARVLTDDDQINGTALFIGHYTAIVPKHSFPWPKGRVRCFDGQVVEAITVVDGGIEPSEGFKADYKIILAKEAKDIMPALLSVSTPTGSSFQINYQLDGELYITPYTSEEVLHGYAMRSDHASVVTLNGDSGGIRVDSIQGVVHSIHQGESEALKINDIVQSLLTIDSKNPKISLILIEMQCIDWQMLMIHASTVALQPDQVIPERHGTLQSFSVSLEKRTAVANDVFEDIKQFFLSFNTAQKKENFFANIWNQTGTIYGKNNFETYQSHGTRLDCQVPTATHANIQIQSKPTIKSDSETVATILVARTLIPYANTAFRRAEVVNYVLHKFKLGVGLNSRKNLAIVQKIELLDPPQRGKKKDY